MTWPGRTADVVDAVSAPFSEDIRPLVDRLTAVSVRGLAHMYEARTQSFPYKVEGRMGGIPPVSVGMSVRYTAIAALGLARLDVRLRQQVLAGRDVGDLLPGILGLALAGRDPGAIALAVWAAAEIGRITPEAPEGEAERIARAVDRLVANVRTEARVPTVEHAWTVVALLATGQEAGLPDLGLDAEQLAEATERAVERLLAAEGPSGLFPHSLPVEDLSRFRSHIGSFADQCYPIQALARYSAVTGDERGLDAAGRCADRLAILRGPQGQWWWHYDWRHGRVVERYPVYSVHQYGMAPMALMELREAGGPDHREAVAQGLTWLLGPAETSGEIIADDLGVVWRTVGRREPRKVVRKLRSAASAGRRPDRRLPWLDAVFPPGPVHRECRPFELGWMLYAWHAPEPLQSAVPVAVPHIITVDPSARATAGER